MKVLSRLLILSLFLPSLALARPTYPVIITWDMGGNLDERYERWVHVREKEQLVVIDGLCFSGCSILTGQVPKELVCITPRAVIGVHSAYTIDRMGKKYDEEGTVMYWYSMSAEFRELVKARGWDGTKEQNTPIMIEYSELKNLYRDCPDYLK
jgi:hypothetical protein